MIKEMSPVTDDAAIEDRYLVVAGIPVMPIDVFAKRAAVTRSAINLAIYKKHIATTYIIDNRMYIPVSELYEYTRTHPATRNQQRSKSSL